VPQQLADGIGVCRHMGRAGQRQDLVGRPTASSAADIRSACVTTTLSSAIPWVSSSGLVRQAAPVMVEDRSYPSGFCCGRPRNRSCQCVS
jgi:hypothetical protein